MRMWAYCWFNECKSRLCVVSLLLFCSFKSLRLKSATSVTHMRETNISYVLLQKHNGKRYLWVPNSDQIKYLMVEWNVTGGGGYFTVRSLYFWFYKQYGYAYSTSFHQSCSQDLKERPSNAYIRRGWKMFGIESGGKMFTNADYARGWKKRILYFFGELSRSLAVEIKKTTKRIWPACEWRFEVSTSLYILYSRPDCVNSFACDRVECVFSEA